MTITMQMQETEHMGFFDEDETSGPSNKGRKIFTKYDRPGTKKSGLIREARQMQQTTMGSDENPAMPKFFMPYGKFDMVDGRKRYWTTDVPAGQEAQYRPMMQWVIEVDTDERSAEIPHDDGVRIFYVDGGKKKATTSEGALAHAMMKAGANDFTPGDRITMWKITAPENGAHTWGAEYVKGTGVYHVKPRVDAEGNEVGGFGANEAAASSAPATSAAGGAGADPWATPSTQSDEPPF